MIIKSLPSVSKAISNHNHAAHHAAAGRDFYAGKVREIYAATRPAPVKPAKAKRK